MQFLCLCMMARVGPRSADLQEASPQDVPSLYWRSSLLGGRRVGSGRVGVGGKGEKLERKNGVAQLADEEGRHSEIEAELAKLRKELETMRNAAQRSEEEVDRFKDKVASEHSSGRLAIKCAKKELARRIVSRHRMRKLEEAARTKQLELGSELEANRAMVVAKEHALESTGHKLEEKEQELETKGHKLVETERELETTGHELKRQTSRVQDLVDDNREKEASITRQKSEAADMKLLLNKLNAAQIVTMDIEQQLRHMAEEKVRSVEAEVRKKAIAKIADLPTAALAVIRGHFKRILRWRRAQWAVTGLGQDVKKVREEEDAAGECSFWFVRASYLRARKHEVEHATEQLRARRWIRSCRRRQCGALRGGSRLRRRRAQRWRPDRERRLHDLQQLGDRWRGGVGSARRRAVQRGHGHA